jgi:hypothetical protein
MWCKGISLHKSVWCVDRTSIRLDSNGGVRVLSSNMGTTSYWYESQERRKEKKLKEKKRKENSREEKSREQA